MKPNKKGVTPRKRHAQQAHSIIDDIRSFELLPIEEAAPWTFEQKHGQEDNMLELMAALTVVAPLLIGAIGQIIMNAVMG